MGTKTTQVGEELQAGQVRSTILDVRNLILDCVTGIFIRWLGFRPKSKQQKTHERWKKMAACQTTILSWI